MVAFAQNDRGDKRPVAAGEVLRKTAGKAMTIQYIVPSKESSGRFQYSLSIPDGVNMVVLIVEDTLQQIGDMEPWQEMGRMPSMPPRGKPYWTGSLTPSLNWPCLLRLGTWTPHLYGSS